jgi:ribose-phosphate pyrophosphokinase
LADRLNADIAIIEKRRPEPGVAEVMNLIGDVRGKTAVMIDDLVDTAGSLVEASNALVRFGAREVYACCTHAVLTDPAVPRIEKSPIKELVVTKTIPPSPEKKSEKIRVISGAPILGEAILRIYNEMSVSQLFNL